MPLSGSQYGQIQEALLSAFPSRSELAQMVRFGLDVNLDHVAGGRSLREITFELIQWAEAHGFTEQLLAAARRAAPGHPALHALAWDQETPVDKPLNQSRRGVYSTRSPSATTVLSPLERMRLVLALDSLPERSFMELHSLLSTPPGVVPGPDVPQAERARFLLQWAEGPGGCGLETVRQVLKEMQDKSSSPHGATLRTGSGREAPIEGTGCQRNPSEPSEDDRRRDLEPSSGWVDRKTVLEMDLVGYSDIVRTLEQNLGPNAVDVLNQQIQQFVDVGLHAVKASREDTLVSTTGDGAILVLDWPEQVHRLATAVHAATREFNSERVESARRWFRMGAFTGDIHRRPRPGGGYEVAGEAIGNAVRLEAAARPGELVVDVRTWEALPAELKLMYGSEEVVPGKREERFRVRRCALNPRPEDARKTVTCSSQPEPSGDRRRIYELFQSLDPVYLDRVMFLMNMPVGRQPSSLLSPDSRRDEILRWASSSSQRLKELEATLEYLLEKERQD